MTLAPETPPADEETKADAPARPTDTKQDEASSGDDRPIHGPNIGRDNTGTINNFIAEPSGDVKAGLIEGPVTDTMVTEATTAFCRPGHFERAGQILQDRHLVVLSGRSSGRSLAGVRLLIDRNVHTLHRLDRGRPLNDLVTHAREHPDPVGYLWDEHAETSGAELGNERVLGLLEQVLRENNAYLVVSFSAEVGLSAAHEHVAELTPPRTADVADAHLKAKRIPADRRKELLKLLDLSKVMPDDSRPGRGAEVARFLAEYDADQIELDEVKQALHQSTDDDVRTWFAGNKSTTSRALAITIALLNDRPYNDIASAAKRLEDVLANPEDEEIWPYSPPDLFHRTREERLRDALATIKIQPGAGDGRTDAEHVRFRQSDWGPRLLRYAWKEFDRIRPFILDWLTHLSKELANDSAAQRETLIRFGKLLANAAEPRPMQWLDDWLGSKSTRHNRMAAIALGALCTNASYVQIVKNHLSWWARPVAPKQYREAVAIACGGEFGKEHPVFAMKQLGTLTKDCDDRLQSRILVAVQELLREPANRGLLIETLTYWLASGQASAATLAYRCSFDALSLTSTPVSLAGVDADVIRCLFSALITNVIYQARAIEQLATWAARPTTGSAIRAKQDLLKILLSGDPSFVRRLSYHLRKYIECNRQSAHGLAQQLALALKEL